MAISRIEISNPDFSPENLMLLTVSSSYLHEQLALSSDNTVRRQDISVYNAYTTQKNVPVVLLLHGVYGNHWAWMSSGGAHLVFDDLRAQGLSEFVLVMPSDGGVWDGSAYLPIKGGANFERWIVDDVLQAVKQSVDGISDSSNIYIAGLSMGGYGALRLGCKYANLFSGISAHSAITQLSDLELFTTMPLSAYATEDTHESDILYWMRQHRDSLPAIRFDCGRDDSLLAANEALASEMHNHNICHSFTVFEGGHEWAYWHQHLNKTLRFFDEIERKLSAKSSL